MQKVSRITQLTLWVALVVITSSGLFGCAGRISDINIFSDTQEVQLGKQFSREIEKEMKIYSDPVVTTYIAQLGQHLASHSQRKNITYHFKVVNTEAVNAFAVPGGYLYVNIGLIRAAENESELAGVIGHEIGHVVGKHGVKQMTRQLGLAAVAQLALGEDQNKLEQMVAGLAANGVLMKYSRDAEREADGTLSKRCTTLALTPKVWRRFLKNSSNSRKENRQSWNRCSRHILRRLNGLPLSVTE